jgi:hypothetical protein
LLTRKQSLVPSLIPFWLARTKVPALPVAQLMVARRPRRIQPLALQVRHRLPRNEHLHLPVRLPPNPYHRNIDSVRILAMANAPMGRRATFAPGPRVSFEWNRLTASLR